MQRAHDERDPDARRVLLTVSGTIPPHLDADVAAGRRPRADYRVLAERLDADVVDVGRARADAGRLGRAIGRAGAGPLLAWYAWRRRRRYGVILTDGEQVGLPLALLMRCFGSGGARHAMIVHIVSVPKKVWFIRATRIAGRIDRWIVYSSAQADFVRSRFRVPPERVVLTPFMVDTGFFEPVRPPDLVRPTICSAGLERRDYRTLLRAVAGLDADVVIAAASPWARRGSTVGEGPLPANVSVVSLPLDGLRDLYARSSVVVMPLEEVAFQAGITTILEAMAMGRAVVCTRTTGQTDTIVDGVTGVYVAPGDVTAMRTALDRLLASDADRDALGAAARAWVVEHAGLDGYADRIAGVVAGMSAGMSSARQ